VAACTGDVAVVVAVGAMVVAVTVVILSVN
jgi:hypothetical protein